MSGLQATSYGLDLVTYVDKGSVIKLIQCTETRQRLGHDSILQKSFIFFFAYSNHSKMFIEWENLFPSTER